MALQDKLAAARQSRDIRHSRRGSDLLTYRYLAVDAASHRVREGKTLSPPPGSLRCSLHLRQTSL